MRNFPLKFVLVFALSSCPGTLWSQQAKQPKNLFLQDVVPFLKKHCYGCHGAKEPEGGLSLLKYRESAKVQSDYKVWEKVLRLVAERQMPPEDEPQPKSEELKKAISGIRAELAKFDCGGTKHPGVVTIRRLNRAEYDNTIRDLTGVDFRPAKDFPSDDVGNGFDNIGDVLTIPPLLLEKYLAAAEQIADRVFADAKSRKRAFPFEAGERMSRREASRKNLSDFVRRAYRRPPTGRELRRLEDLMRLAREQTSSEDEAFKTAMQAILASPHFLFRIERHPTADDKDGIRKLNGYELATRLSYFLWSSMPDAALFKAAADDSLTKRDVMIAQVKRMLHDPKAKALTSNFAGQWLQLRNLAEITPDRKRFPDFDEALRSAMLRETELFFEAIVKEDRSILDFLAGDFSFVNKRLARHYGLKGVRGEGYQRVKLSGQRRGVLTHASILLLTSNPTRTSPVKRGKWILDNFLGEPPPPPPDGIEPFDEEAVTLGSLRERMEQHRNNKSCAVCHEKMDTLGFGLENFDVIGAWRERDGRFAIEPAGQLPGGRKFTSPKQLMQILAEEKKVQFSRCLAEKMLTYAVGRGLRSYDRCAVDTIVKQLAGNDYRFSVLVTEIVTSDPFTLIGNVGEK